jgi:7-keto-8-aminopelargonate synthetase-like enzyme
VFAHGVRPPTVPPGTSRLRFTIIATHTEAHIERAIAALKDNRSLLS